MCASCQPANSTASIIKVCIYIETKRGGGGSRPGWWRLTLLPESFGPHSPLSYHHLFFSLSKTPASLSFNTARFTGVLQIMWGTGKGGENNINNIIGHVILCYSIRRSPKRAAQYSSQSDEAGKGPHFCYMSLCS